MVHAHSRGIDNENALGPAVTGILRVAAAQIQSGIEPQVDLYDFREIGSCSTQQVADAISGGLTDSALSIRPVESKYFATAIQGRAHYLGLFRADTCEQLFWVGRYAHGFGFSDRASAESLARAEKFHAECARQRTQEAAGESFASGLRDKLAAQIIAKLGQTRLTEEQRTDLEYHCRNVNGATLEQRIPKVELKNLFIVAATLGVEA